MKVALAIPADPPGTNNFNQIPIGALYTAARLREAGVEVAFRDFRRSGTLGYDEVGQADLSIVFSTDYDLAQCYPSLEPTRACIRRIRAAGPVRTVCCGSHATAAPGSTLTFTGADAVAAGEFEMTVPSLVEHLRAGGTLPALWPPGGEPATATEPDLAALGQPAYDLAPIREYASEGFIDGHLRRVRSGLILANRGCPYACNFCYLFFGRRLRRRPVEAVLGEMGTLHGLHRLEHFFFLDYTFTLDDAWVRDLCSALRARLPEVRWICQTRVDCLQEDTLRMMRDSGCTGVWLGVESPELAQRRYLSKGRIEFQQIEDAVATIRRAGLEVLTFVMVGLPNETESSLHSLNKWLNDSGVYYSLSTFRRRPGTPLAAATPDAPVDWSHLDVTPTHLGESRLRLDRLVWFTELHASSPRRVANVLRGQVPV